MKRVRIEALSGYPVEDEESDLVYFSRTELESRLHALLELMHQRGVTHAVVYGDREHFANLEYLTGFDPRFEESLLILESSGRLTLLLGNECYGYSQVSPLNLNRVLFQDFSLQGQPRDNSNELGDILSECGIRLGSRVGLIGFKYYRDSRSSDIPSYIVDEIRCLVGSPNAFNFTDALTHLDYGLRLRIRTASEVAYFENAANRTSSVVRNIINSLMPGITELEASRQARYDASPISMFPIVNFGDTNVKLGLRSPGQRELRMGDPVTICYAIRGSLVARSGLAAYSREDLRGLLHGAIEDFYFPYFRGISGWYESLEIGASGGDIYAGVMDVLGDHERFGLYLNPGHHIATDEWVNSPFFAGSPHHVQPGHYLQCDIIAARSNPFLQAIVEDGVIIADAALQTELTRDYPKVASRIARRRVFMRETLGIEIGESVLPLSNIPAVCYPYMFDSHTVLTMRG
ncbi:MAG TPA: hypothetical protein VK905_04260 [Bacillota bacterium]|nr:hypothetical protein [Bacillota bacterium]